LISCTNMKVPESLANAFGAEFEEWIVRFAFENKLLPEIDTIKSPRYLVRSVVPHVNKLSSLFNRKEKDQESGLNPYWKESSNPTHLRLAYFLYFMPCNLFRVAAVWSELTRLGFKWPAQTLKAVEFGAGPATGACGIAAGEKYAPAGLPKSGSWALIEQDKQILELGAGWAETYFNKLGMTDWGIKPFHRKIDSEKGFLPPAAPKFNLWLMSYYLNETLSDPVKLASTLIQNWKDHLEDESIIIIIEPALKLQSRRLLALRREILAEREKKKIDWLQVLLPCLGHQACGALANPEDWCHEEVTWWRPPYIQRIDKMAGLDRKSLPFSYLVLMKSKRSRDEILPALKVGPDSQRHRLVSPSHEEGRELEFFICGQEGKRRTRYRPKNAEDHGANLNRGDIIVDAEIRGDVNSARISKIGKVI
jgi:hypothetical protein